VLTSWGVNTEEAVGRIETYRRRYFGSGPFQKTYNLKDYIGYRLSTEFDEWPKSPDQSDLLIRFGIDRCQQFFAKIPPGIVVMSDHWGEPDDRIGSIPLSSLKKCVDGPDYKRDAETQDVENAQGLDQLKIYKLNGDRIWTFWIGPAVVTRGYALVRGDTIVKAVTHIAAFVCGPGPWP